MGFDGCLPLEEGQKYAIRPPWKRPELKEMLSNRIILSTSTMYNRRSTDSIVGSSLWVGVLASAPSDALANTSFGINTPSYRLLAETYRP